MIYIDCGKEYPFMSMSPYCLLWQHVPAPKQAVLCPVCNGAGKLPVASEYQTTGMLHPDGKICHGCGGLGWVTV